jgi:hypothetical protein
LISQIRVDAVDEPPGRQTVDPGTSPARHVEIERPDEAKDLPTGSSPGSTLPSYVFRSNNNVPPTIPFTPPAPRPLSLEPLPPAPSPEAPEAVDLITPAPDPASRSRTLTSTAPGADPGILPASGQSDQEQDLSARETSSKAGPRGRSKRKKQGQKKGMDSAGLDPVLAERMKRPGWIRRLVRKMLRRVAWPD